MDITQIVTDIGQALIPLAVAYFVQLRKDLNAAHCKLRNLQSEIENLKQDMEDFK